MGLDIVEATSGMGMHLKDIPPNILERQLKVCLILSTDRNLSNQNQSGLLAHDPLLQCRRPLRKSIHSHAILPRLPHPAYAHCVLGHDHYTGSLWNLVRGQRLLDLCACGQVLEPYPPWLLLEQAWSVVFECQYAHFH